MSACRFPRSGYRAGSRPRGRTAPRPRAPSLPPRQRPAGPPGCGAPPGTRRANGRCRAPAPPAARPAAPPAGSRCRCRGPARCERTAWPPAPPRPPSRCPGGGRRPPASTGSRGSRTPAGRRCGRDRFAGRPAGRQHLQAGMRAVRPVRRARLRRRPRSGAAAIRAGVRRCRPPPAGPPAPPAGPGPGRGAALTTVARCGPLRPRPQALLSARPARPG